MSARDFFPNALVRGKEKLGKSIFVLTIWVDTGYSLCSFLLALNIIHIYLEEWPNSLARVLGKSVVVLSMWVDTGHLMCSI